MRVSGGPPGCEHGGMARGRRALGLRVALVVTTVVGMLGLTSAPPADAAGIVTHAWMALDAIDQVQDADLHAVLDAHRDQVRAGAEFPDGGYWTRTLGTPGGDYGEEAHWQRFVDAAVDRLRADPDCGDLTDPAGPCAASIAQLFGAAGHGMGDEVWDWLFEPNAPAFGEDYLPPEWAPFVGSGGIEAQMDQIAIAQHARPTGATPEIPDPSVIMDAFAAIGRADIQADALPVGEQMLEVERGVEAAWAPDHAAAVARAMPWTAAHVTSAGGGVDFAAHAIAGYYEGLWSRLTGTPHRTRVGAVAPAPGARRVPATGWTGSYGPGSHLGNSAGTTRIAAALSTALPYRPLATGDPVASELPADTFVLRVAATGLGVPPRPGYPRIVPYGPDAGEHVIAFQPAADLVPCTWYRAEVTDRLRDARGNAVESRAWEFRTSGCTGRGRGPVRGTVTCAAHSLVAADATGAGGAITGLEDCTGGQDGRVPRKARLPIAHGVGLWHVGFPAGGCAAFAAGAGATIGGDVRWTDAAGRVVGWSHVDPQPVDVRGGVVTVAGSSRVLPGHTLSVRLDPGASPCAVAAGVATTLTTSGRVTAWEPTG